ncbi:MAG: hypothetical protein KJ970_16360 [Candidatus Eisenbacteria bacterium]|uniref:Lipoprotein n=1 Tax=Eiseniibacteriota bacterium TaxID=2212470 RepID=A0A948S273_UNCEI|nr:hypothetical protein [Candidatus Eisenbacteria bacterium]MBU1951108.1 hypothetical protein [Candidatus Eisenbacteria bacterium]MBU2692494.1 hypothetical protein [Candidatus Eisenbacteria bacterium]
MMMRLFRLAGIIALVSLPMLLMIGCSATKNKKGGPEVDSKWVVTSEEKPGSPKTPPWDITPKDSEDGPITLDPSGFQKDPAGAPVDDPFYPPEIKKIRIYRNQQKPKCPYEKIGFVRAQNLDADHAENMLKVKISALGGHGAVDVKWFTFDTDHGEETWLLGTAFVFTDSNCTEGW